MAGLEELTHLLVRLMAHDCHGASEDEVWDSVLGRGLQAQTSSEMRQSLEEVKLCLLAVKVVQDRLGRRLRFLRKACMHSIMESGLRKLPDDILSHIFEAGHMMSKGWSFARSVSQVSARFRQISFRTPLLWTRIFATYPPDQIREFIHRSGQMDLEVFPDARDWNNFDSWRTVGNPVEDMKVTKQEELFYEISRECTHRWAHLQLDLAGPRILEVPMMEECGLTDFPRLRSLAPHDWNSFAHWRLPSLSHVGGRQTRFDPNFPFLGQVTSLTLCPDFDDINDIYALTETLYSLKNLQHFSLTLRSGIGDAAYDSEDSEPEPEPNAEVERLILDVHSVHIGSLEIYVQAPTPRKVVSLAFDALSFLAPSTSTIFLEISGKIRPEAFLYASTGKFFPYGSTISLRIVDTDVKNTLPPKGFRLLTRLVRGSQIARSIDIEAPTLGLIRENDLTGNWKDFAILRRLSFKHCHQLREQDVKFLVERLIINTDPDMGLKLLELISCRQLSKEFLLALGDEFGSKVKWQLWLSDSITVIMRHREGLLLTELQWV
ncbi:hypothetical protein BD410DRAFT_845857 [Rickenella mellea]|uniref:F-box domain-containing protein n=1 Tax=Rickenella mellea TaxID=50990 RepID=A0A4Y7PHW9_9AGAM|nr:hypothetical protein BD410DRAFT_845857 [Rickenella mellea]